MEGLSLGQILRGAGGAEWRVLHLKASRHGERIDVIELLALDDERADQWHKSFSLNYTAFKLFCAREGLDGFTT